MNDNDTGFWKIALFGCAMMLSIVILIWTDYQSSANAGEASLEITGDELDIIVDSALPQCTTDQKKREAFSQNEDLDHEQRFRILLICEAYMRGSRDKLER